MEANDRAEVAAMIQNVMEAARAAATLPPPEPEQAVGRCPRGGSCPSKNKPSAVAGYCCCGMRWPEQAAAYGECGEAATPAAGSLGPVPELVYCNTVFATRASATAVRDYALRAKALLDTAERRVAELEQLVAGLGQLAPQVCCGKESTCERRCVHALRFQRDRAEKAEADLREANAKLASVREAAKP